MKIRFKFCALMTTLLVVNGCGVQNWQTHDVVDRNVQSSPPPVERTAEASARISPLEAHLRARRQVDPSDTRPTHSYTVLASALKYKPPKPLRKPSATQRRKGRFLTAQAGLNTKPEQSRGAAPKSVANQAKAPAPVETAAVSSSVAAPNAPLSAFISTPATPPARKPLIFKTTKPEIKSYRVSDIKPAAGISASKAIVGDLRFGQHPDKTRFVFDFSKDTKFAYKLSRDKRTLDITLKDTHWQAAGNRQYAAHPYVSGYQAFRQGEDVVVRFSMKRAVKFMKWAGLPPNGATGHRIYFDVKPI